MEKISLYHNSDMEAYANQYPEETAPHAERMILRLKNGQVIQEEQIFIRGMTRRPLSFEDVQAKYQDCGQVAGLSPARIDQLVDLTRELERMDSLRPLIDLMRVP
jgi:2-methylcitrate dehydratase PrpD